MALSKRLRYEILRRDNHACTYCGATAPDVKLTVDHVIPVALGGSDDPTNLVAACRDCNAGKSASNPDAPLVAAVAQDVIRWRDALLEAARLDSYDRLSRDAHRDNFTDAWNGWGIQQADGTREPLPLPVGWPLTIDRLSEGGLYMDDIDDAVDIAMRTTSVTNDNKFRYFAGICWKKLSQRQEMARQMLDAEDAGGEF